MVTLMSWGNGSGQRRRCDAHCYNAKHPGCTCVCGGANHGTGLERAAQNVAQHGREMIERLADQGDPIAKDLAAQLPLPTDKPTTKINPFTYVSVSGKSKERPRKRMKRPR